MIEGDFRMGVKRCDCGQNIAYKMERCNQCELDRLRAENEELHNERIAVCNALNTTEYLDPPDGGDVPIHEQIRRMKEERDHLRRQLAAAEPVLKAAEEWTQLYEDHAVDIDDEVFVDARIKLRLSVHEWREKK